MFSVFSLSLSLSLSQYSTKYNLFKNLCVFHLFYSKRKKVWRPKPVQVVLPKPKELPAEKPKPKEPVFIPKPAKEKPAPKPERQPLRARSPVEERGTKPLSFFPYCIVCTSFSIHQKTEYVKSLIATMNASLLINFTICLHSRCLIANT